MANMLSAAQAGPLGVGARGNQDMGGGAPPASPMKPCPACQGAGEIDAAMDTQSLIAQIEQGDMGAEGEGMRPPDQGQSVPGAPPERMAAAPPPSPDADRQRVRDYAQNRPPRLADQPINEDKVLTDGARIRERMRRPGMVGRA